MLRISIQRCKQRTKFYLPTILFHIPYRSSNLRNFLVFCLHKNAKIQNETNISATFGRLKHRFFTTSALRFDTSPCLRKNTTYLPSLGAKQCKTRKACGKF